MHPYPTVLRSLRSLGSITLLALSLNLTLGLSLDLSLSASQSHTAASSGDSAVLQDQLARVAAPYTIPENEVLAESERPQEWDPSVAGGRFAGCGDSLTASLSPQVRQEQTLQAVPHPRTAVHLRHCQWLL